MTLTEVLDRFAGEIVGEAADALSRAQLKHYERSGAEQNRERLSKLYDLTRRCERDRDLIPMLEYAREVARERYRAGFDLLEVHSAFNVLEEVIWRRITSEMSPPDYPEAFGLVSTILGAGKQALAVEYVTLASHREKVESLDLRALFNGT